MPLTIKRTNSTSIAANSVLFDGSNQYLSVGSVANWAFLNNGLTPFTIEAWVNPTSVATAVQPTIVSTTGYKAQIGFYFVIGNYNNGDFTFAICNGGQINQWSTSNNFLTANTWTHVAVSFTPNGTNVPSATVKFFVNGVLATSSNVLTNTTTYSTSNPTNTLLVGAYQTPFGGYFPGKMSNLRILNGTALYTSSFTVPTSPLTAIANTALLTCNAATIVDNSTNNFTITNNNAATVSSINPFRAPINNFQFARRASTAVGRSVQFDGSNQYLTTANVSNFVLTGDFTTECFVNLSALPTTQKAIINYWNAASNNRSIYWNLINSGGAITMSFGLSSDGTSANSISIDNGWNPTLNTWYHIAVSRKSNIATMFVDGNQLGTTQSLSISNKSVAAPLAICADYPLLSAAYYFNGRISNLRIVKGTAVYTASFTAPTAPLTAIANTSLLTCNADTIVDSSPNNFTITNNNSATVSSVSPFVASSGGMSLKKVYADAIVVYLTQKAIFGYGSIGPNRSMINLVSNTGVVATDTAGVGTARDQLAAAGYGTDKAIFGYGNTTFNISLTNLVSNTGVVATDTAGVGTARGALGAACYGVDKAIFGYGFTASVTATAITNLVSNTGVVATDTAGVGTARSSLAASRYGADKAIFGYGQNAYNSTDYSMTNLVSNTGVVATDTTGVGTVRYGLAAAGYGTDKAIFGYGRTSTSHYSITNLVSNTGVVATNATGVGTVRDGLAAAGYGTDKAIFGYGYPGWVSITNLVSNTGVVATDTAGVGTGRRLLAAAGFSLT